MKTDSGSIIANVNNNRFIDQQSKIVITILQLYNCRISEVLDSTWKEFHPDKFLIIKGKKRSANIIVRDRELLKEINSLQRHSSEKIFCFTYYLRIYRYILRYFPDLVNQVQHTKNKKVTHAFRYKNVSGIVNDGIIMDILHHRTERSGKYYKNKS